MNKRVILHFVNKKSVYFYFAIEYYKNKLIKGGFG